VQEAREKYPELRREHPDLDLHLVGHLQSKKAEEAVEIFDVIQSVDREKVAAALARAAEKVGRTPVCYVQVNTGEEAQKGGVAPGETAALVARCRELGLPVRGLMAIPPVDEEPAPHFALLAELAGELALPELSMGMSGDLETAVKLGATCVRVGTDVFGERPA
jgi:pyridoxal phosphate enzyme (YggS family)